MISSENTVSIIEQSKIANEPSINLIVYTDSVPKDFKAFYQFASPESSMYWVYGDSINNMVKKQFIEYYERNGHGRLLAILKNHSKVPVELHTQDGSLCLIQEALNTKGEWKPIEFFTYSSCGFGQHNIFLNENEQVRIVVRKYTGDIKTKLRLKLLTENGVIYSSEFDGHINKGQFKIPKFVTKDKTYYSFLEEKR